MSTDSETENAAFEALYGKFSKNISSFDLRLCKPDMRQGSKPSILWRTYFTSNACNALMYLVVTDALLLIFAKGKKAITILQPNRRKGILSLVWATFVMCHIFNIYMVGKVFIASCYLIHTKNENSNAVVDCSYTIFYVTTLGILGTIIAYTHSKFLVLPIPELLFI